VRFHVRRSRISHVRTGFTLLEVLVAVLISATLLISADMVFEQLAESRTETASSALQRDETQDAGALVRRWVRQIDISPEAGPPHGSHNFGGDSAQMRFTSWCVAAGGWERECDISVRTRIDSTGAALLAESSYGDSARTELRDSTIVLRYLMDAANGGHWVNNWPIGPTVPIAIGVVSRSDTIVYRVGARG
jgi:prepilin-type N-terminal cleavage/methylation domain-containing protein